VIRRALPVIAVVAGVAAAASGCGSSSSALDDALGYLPKSTPVAIAVKTDLKDSQYRQLDTLLKRFPFYNLLKQRVMQGVSAGGNRATLAQVKPLLGNDVVIGFPNAGSAGGTSSSATVVAWKTKDGGKAESLIKHDSRKVGSEDGATLYQSPSGDTTAINSDTLVSSKDRSLLDAALKQRGKGDRLREDTFKAGLAGVPTNAIVRVYGNLQQLLSSGRAASAKQVPWVGALRTFGATVTAASDGLLVDFHAKTQGSLTPAQLPIASGAAPPKIVRQPGEVAVALRDPAQTLGFAEQALVAATPQGALVKPALNRSLGIDIDRDVIGALGPGSAASIAPKTGTVVARADLKDPAKFNATLATIAKNLPKAGSLARGTTLTPGPDGLYQLKPRTGKATFIGVAGKELVVGQDPGAAVKFASAAATTATGAGGALATTLNPQQIITLYLTARGGSAAAIAGAFIAPLKDLSGYVDSETSGLTARFKLTISR